YSLNGETLVAHIPVTDSWGEESTDLSCKRMSLVIADSGLAKERKSIVFAGLPAKSPGLGWVFMMALD
ncbi:hypothetical protein, partial [Raoultella ornithinolytica]|uniref:hypothetical protein n=1 Tax=Raoultella ornithinolytica TaxID=54291 RepID=UPI001952243B